MSFYFTHYEKQDEYYTPEYAVIPITKYVKPHSKIWCPFDKEWSQFVKIFKEQGHDVIYTHIDKGEDFFNVEVPECDYIISNPPFSLKNEVIKYLYEIGKPFAMLLNISGLFDQTERFNIFNLGGAEALVLFPRVRYLKQLNKHNMDTKNPPFQSCYLCRGMIPNGLEFARVNIKPEQTKLWED